MSFDDDDEDIPDFHVSADEEDESDEDEDEKGMELNKDVINRAVTYKKGLKKTKSCELPWYLDSVLGQGRFAYVFSGCNDEKVCNVSIRVSGLHDTKKHDGFEKNYKIYNLLAAKKVTPTMYDIFVCSALEEDLGVLVTERYDGNLMDLVIHHPDVYQRVSDIIKKQVTNQLAQLHAAGWVHRDMGWQNVVYKMVDGQHVEVACIDFDDASLGSDLGERMTDAYQAQDMNTTNLMFKTCNDIITFFELLATPASQDDIIRAWKKFDVFEQDKLRSKVNDILQGRGFQI